MGRREDIETRLRQLEAERAQLDRYGDDVYEDGDVIKFVKTFKILPRNGVGMWVDESNEAHKFTFVALKCENDLWYLTGRGKANANGQTWDQLVEFMYAGIPAADIQIAMDSDFLTLESYRDRLTELARLATDLDIRAEIPEVSIRRGGVRFPSRGTWSGVDSEPTAPSGEEQVDAIGTGGWSGAVAAADLKHADVDDKNNDH